MSNTVDGVPVAARYAIYGVYVVGGGVLVGLVRTIAAIASLIFDACHDRAVLNATRAHVREDAQVEEASPTTGRSPNPEADAARARSRARLGETARVRQRSSAGQPGFFSRAGAAAASAANAAGDMMNNAGDALLGAATDAANGLMMTPEQRYENEGYPEQRARDLQQLFHGIIECIPVIGAFAITIDEGGKYRNNAEGVSTLQAHRFFNMIGCGYYAPDR